MYSLDISIKTGRSKLREEFQRNSHIRDPRIIDMLVIKVLPLSGGWSPVPLFCLLFCRVKWSWRRQHTCSNRSHMLWGSSEKQKSHALQTSCHGFTRVTSSLMHNCTCHVVHCSPPVLWGMASRWPLLLLYYQRYDSNLKEWFMEILSQMCRNHVSYMCRTNSVSCIACTSCRSSYIHVYTL